MTKKTKKNTSSKSAASNRRAKAKYEIIETLEAGLVLTGPEVKSLRAGKANLQDGFVRIEPSEEAFLWNVHITPYAQASTHVEVNPTRKRKLLLNKSEIRKWFSRSTIKGFAIIPLEIYFNERGKAKVRIGLGKGKQAADRREDIKKRVVNREMRRAFAEKQKVK